VGIYDVPIKAAGGKWTYDKRDEKAIAQFLHVLNERMTLPGE
jgi:hypothetical protein